MSLIDDVREYYKSASYPPMGGEVDAKQISYEVIDDSPRWGDVIQVVYERGDEIVAVEDVEPATEMQDWGDYGDPTIYEAKPQVVTVTKYVKV